MWTLAGVFLAIILCGSIGVAVNDSINRTAREIRAREARRRWLR